MKKICLYMCIVIGICFFIPIFFTIKFKNEEVSTEEVEILEVDEYSYSDFEKIKLLHISTGEIEEIGLDEYITSVVAAEMPVSYDIEALKAQSIAARTYTIYKIINGTKHENADICDDSSCCQAWISKEDRIEKWGENGNENWNKIVEAVNATLRRSCYIRWRGNKCFLSCK